MVTVEKISGGRYRIDSDCGPASITVSLKYLNQLLVELQAMKMIEQRGQRITPPGR